MTKTYNIYFKEALWKQYVISKFPVGTAIMLSSKSREPGQLNPFIRTPSNSSSRANGHWINIIKCEKIMLDTDKKVCSVDDERPPKDYQARLMASSGLNIRKWKDFIKTVNNPLFHNIPSTIYAVYFEIL